MSRLSIESSRAFVVTTGGRHVLVITADAHVADGTLFVASLPAGYATPAQADSYIRNYYVSGDPLRVAWTALSSEDKCVSLRRAERIIDYLPFCGRPATEGRAFPRYPDKEVPIEVTQATIELAVQSLNTDVSERFELSRQGVRSYRLGDLSEDLSGVSSPYPGVSAHAYSIIFPFLRKWIGGGYSICVTRTRR